MPIYPSKVQVVLFSLGELVRWLIRGQGADWTSWLLRRLADRQLSEPRRRTFGAHLFIRARSQIDASLARDAWLAGKDLWPELRKATIAVLVCEAAAWLRDKSTFEDAFAVGERLFTESGRARLEFLRDVYLNQPAAGVPRLMQLPVPLAHDGLLPYVDDYARARIADSQSRFAVALEYYQRALASLPRDDAAYEFARNRCNTIRNMETA